MNRCWGRLVLGVIVLSLSAGAALAGPRFADRGQTPPVVVRADVDRLEPDRLVIRGAHFGTTTAPTVLLAQVPLQVLSFNDNQILVRLPIDAPAARYRLQVLAHGTSPSAVVEVVLGSATAI
ncbi:MAG TPA: IPT/TIG domain-containing protein [Patescibacteria group bacterium]|jgi:hypothetical protein|nr:IPT/TIG domain-containing protein [Patescibacteria group bacterium]